jgi:hypothetical protein
MLSERKTMFMAQNGRIPAQLMFTDLFGYVKYAFVLDFDRTAEYILEK